MEVKLVEVRDRATFIAAIAVRLLVDPALRDDEQRVASEIFLLRRAGYALEQVTMNNGQEPYVLFGYLDGAGQSLHYDPYGWASRTMANAHKWLIEHWDDFDSGGVLDVEFILGEVVRKPKVSERLEGPLA